MDALLKDNYILIYLFTIILFLKPENLEDNQKIFFVYFITFFIDFVKVIPTAILLSVSIFSIFLYLEYFQNSNFRRKIMTKFSHKVVDFIFLMFLQYSFLSFVFIIFLNSEFFMQFLYVKFGECSIYVLRVLQILICIFLTNNLFAMPWKIKELDDIKIELESICKIYNLPNKFNINWFSTVVLLEDKSFYKRQTYGTIFTYSFWKDYLFPRLKRGIIKKLRIINLKRIFRWINENKFNVINKIRLLFRGYSTIEAQLIRTIGIESGYKLTFKRKLFEIIYTKLFFENLKKVYEKYNYANCSRMKDYLLYVYLHKAKVAIKGKTYIGLKKLFCKEIGELSDEELFIGTLAFSKYSLTKEDIRYYAEHYHYNISDELISDIYDSIK